MTASVCEKTEKFTSIDGATHRTSLSRPTIERLLANGVLTRYRVGRRVLISVEQLDEYVMAQRQA